MDLKNTLFPFKINDVEPEVNAELLKYFTGERSGYIQIGPKKYLLPIKYKQEAANIYNMVIRPDDIFVASFPRSGTTWTQELVWMVANDLDIAKSNAVPLVNRYVFLEISALFHPQMIDLLKNENKDSELNLKILEHISQPGHEQAAASPSPRFIKTHLPMSLLPPNLVKMGKTVYVARDPRDVSVSFYHLHRTMKTQGFIGDFRTYWNFFVNDLDYWAPYFEHVKEAWNKRNDPNFLFLFYEELSKDLTSQIRRVAKFLNKQYSEEQIQKLCEHLSFKNFTNNKSVNLDNLLELKIRKPEESSFIRQGKTGGWRDYFDEEMIKQTDKWMAENLKDTDFRFPHLGDKICNFSVTTNHTF